jgi:hypothetical protein
MQFEHPHGFRPQVRDLVVSEWPQAWRAWLDLGAEPVDMPALEGLVPVGVLSRRATYERALRRAAAEVDGMDVRVGRVERLVERGGRVQGVVVDGTEARADLVIDAGGRLSRLAPPPQLGEDTGMAYVTRTFRRRPDAPLGPSTSPAAWGESFHGYDAYIFFHERWHISAVLIWPTADAALGRLRHVAAYGAAARAIPGVAVWTDPRYATPTSGVLVGGRLLNTYRPQADLPGLVAVGDTVTTTAPTAGRGIAMASMQIQCILELLDGGADPVTIAAPFGEWCDTWMRPWVEDHLAMDRASVRRWQGLDLDLASPLASSSIVAAAQVDARIRPHVGRFLNMTALPESLRPAEPLARAVYESGWRAPVGDGPTRDELVATISDASATPRTTDDEVERVAG